MLLVPGWPGACLCLGSPGLALWDVCGGVAVQRLRCAAARTPHRRQVEINGRAMHIGRPKGYVAPAPGEKVPPAGSSAAGDAPAAAPIAVAGGMATVVLLLSGILPAGQLRTEAERRVVSLSLSLRLAGEGGGGQHRSSELPLQSCPAAPSPAD